VADYMNTNDSVYSQTARFTQKYTRKLRSSFVLPGSVVPGNRLAGSARPSSNVGDVETRRNSARMRLLNAEGASKDDSLG